MPIARDRIWRRLYRSIIDNPGRFAGGSAVAEPLAQLAVERADAAAPFRTPNRDPKRNATP
jgi:hypothetical protein